MSKKHLLVTVAVIAAALVSITVFTLVFGESDGGGQGSQSEIAVHKNAEDPYCLLVAGKDRTSGLSDVIMLISFDPKKDRISVLQIPRDTYVEYGSRSYNKINGALNFLEEEGLVRLFEDSLGVPIDGYLTLDLDAFGLIVDAVGGVEMTLDEPLRYRDPSQDLVIDLPAGRQKLDGRQAEMYVRYRSGYARGDIDRLDAQKKFLSAFFDTLKREINADNAYSIASTLIKSVNTDVGVMLGTALGLEAIKVDSENLYFFTLPGAPALSSVSGASYYVMSAKPAQRILCEYFGKKGENIDGARIFAHSTYPEFIKIYENDAKTEPIRSSELK